MISIVIITHYDPGVTKTLEALTKQVDFPTPAEVIVVDSSGGKLTGIKEQYPCVRWIEYMPRKHITIPHQRNVGVAAAKGKIIVFIDASCVPRKDWLLQLYKHYKEGERIVSGRIVPSDENVVNNISPRVKEGSNYLDECATANVLIAREVFDTVGVFDEEFEYGSDSDFMWRARDKGYNIYYARESNVVHDWGKKGKQYRRSFYYGRGRMRLYLKHPSRLHEIFLRDPIVVVYPMLFLLLPMVFVFPSLYLLLWIIIFLKNWNSRPLETLILNSIYGLGGLSMLRNLLWHRLMKVFRQRS